MNVVKRPVADTAPESEGDLPFLESSLSRPLGGDRQVHNCHVAGSNEWK